MQSKRGRIKVRAARQLRVVLSLAAAASAITVHDVESAGLELTDQLRHGPGVLNHPVGVVPSRAVHIPDGWPLRPDGSITCGTCHAKLPSLTPGSDPRLRGVDGAAAEPDSFCQTCHAHGDRQEGANVHWMALRRAHVRDDPQSASQARGTLDAESRRCMTCHDGISAVEFSNSTPWSPARRGHGDRRGDHPVGVDYPREGKRGSRTPFRAVSLLPSQVRLPAGKVGCTSCHNLYSSEPGRLTVPIEGSALCMTCHEMI